MKVAELINLSISPLKRELKAVTFVRVLADFDEEVAEAVEISTLVAMQRVRCARIPLPDLVEGRFELVEMG